MDTLLRLSEIEMFSEPFHYAVSPEALDPDVCRTVLTWFETEAPWRLVEADFYEQFEFSLWDVQMPERLFFLRERPFLRAITTKIASLFQVALSERVDITAHQLVPGQRIRLHNDFIPGYETILETAASGTPGSSTTSGRVGSLTVKTMRGSPTGGAPFSLRRASADHPPATKAIA